MQVIWFQNYFGYRVMCQVGKDYHIKNVPPRLHELQPHLAQWHMLVVYTMDPFAPCQGKRYILTFIYCSSRFIIIIPVANHNASTVARELMKNVVFYFRGRARIFYDCRSEFTSSLWSKLQHAFRYSLVNTSPYHLQGNTIVRGSIEW